jgi:hypothetical protein
VRCVDSIGARLELISINAAAAVCFKLSRMSTTLTLAERAVPRYTSYPTAPHFSPDVGAETYAAWLAALPAQATLSLYLHVPYCSERRIGSPGQQSSGSM